MARPDAEHSPEEESEDPQPGVGTDPARAPQDDDGQHRVISPDEEKMEEAERERKEGDESAEERAGRIKNA